MVMAACSRSYTDTQLAPVNFNPAASLGRSEESLGTDPSLTNPSFWSERNPFASLSHREGVLSGWGERGEGPAASALRGVSRGEVGDPVIAFAAGDGPGGEESLAP